MIFSDYLEGIVKLLAGLGVFLVGMRLVSDNMERLAGNSLKSLFNRTTNNKLAGVGMGAVTTAVIHSSAVTTCMVVGFVNTGIMSLEQAAAVIMGANIGTTITAQIAALQSFSFTTYITAFAAIGVFMAMFSKKDKVKSIGLSLSGLGLLFVGLSSMSSSMTSITNSDAVIHALQTVSNPFVLLLIGVGLTALVQSSTAITSVVIALVSTGVQIGTGGNCILYVILGTNIGTCVTALLSSVGTNKNAKRACLIHLLFNVLGTMLFMILLLCWQDFMNVTFAKWFEKPETQIAMFHTFFNLLCTILFLPFSKCLVKLTQVLIPEKKNEKEEDKLCMYIDKRFLSTPAMAIGQIRLEIDRMANMAIESYRIAYEGFENHTVENIEKVYANNDKISKISDAITEYLISVSASGLSLEGEREINSLHNNASDIVRISDLADNLTKYTRREVNENLQFSAPVKDQLKNMDDLIMKQFDTTERIIKEKNSALIPQADEIERQIDNLRKALIADHIERMTRGDCKAENNSVFVNLVSNMERIGDHLNYMAHSIENL